MKTIAIIILAACLAGCAEYPVALSINGQYGVYSYSAKRGFEIQVDATK